MGIRGSDSMRRIGSAAVVVLLCLQRGQAAPAAAAGAALTVSSSASALQAHVAPQAEADTGVQQSSGKVGDMGMQMTFFAGNTFDLWFTAFHVHSAGTLTGACLGVVVMAALYEGLKVARIMLAGKLESSGIRTKGHWIQAFLHMTEVAVSYFLMLAVMTYSTWMMLSVVAGAGIGYAIFATLVPTKAVLYNANDHCH